MDLKITFGKQNKIVALREYVLRILNRLDMEGALVTDESTFGDFADKGRDEKAYRNGKYTLAELFWFKDISENDYIWEVASRIKTCEVVHRLCTQNELSLKQSKRCTCCFCFRTFGVEKVEKYTSRDSGICPFCSVDILLPDFHGVKLSKKQRSDFVYYWFEPTKYDCDVQCRNRKQKHGKR